MVIEGACQMLNHVGATFACLKSMAQCPCAKVPTWHRLRDASCLHYSRRLVLSCAVQSLASMVLEGARHLRDHVGATLSVLNLPVDSLSKASRLLPGIPVGCCLQMCCKVPLLQPQVGPVPAVHGIPWGWPSWAFVAPFALLKAGRQICMLFWLENTDAFRHDRMHAASLACGRQSKNGRHITLLLHNS